MNEKAKPHKQSLVVWDQNGIRVLGLCCCVSEEFDHKDLTLVALYYAKICCLPHGRPWTTMNSRDFC